MHHKQARDDEQQSSPSASLALPSPPASNNERSDLAEENKWLRAQLLQLRAELRAMNQQAALQRPLSPHSPHQSAEQAARSGPSAVFSSPPRSRPLPQQHHSESRISTGFATPPRKQRQQPIRKINRHPSGGFSVDTGIEHVDAGSADHLAWHESGRGLKNRRHLSPMLGSVPNRVISISTAGPKIQSAPKPFRTAADGGRPHSGGGATVPDLSLNKHHQRDQDYDSETASFLKNVVPPPFNTTPEAVGVSVRTKMTDDRADSSDMSSSSLHPPPPQQQSSFWAAVQDRAGWLVGLLVLQSMSSFIISRNEKMLQKHLVIVRFLTMLVGAGGNAGNQASVGVIRGLATGTVHDRNQKETLLRELKMGLALSALLGLTGAIRALVFLTPLTETLAITTSLVAIVFISVFLGAVLPLVMKFFRVDPAHSSTTIQVVMDILGVTITVCKCGKFCCCL